MLFEPYKKRVFHPKGPAILILTFSGNPLLVCAEQMREIVLN